jgi:hypothetical protein
MSRLRALILVLLVVVLGAGALRLIWVKRSAMQAQQRELAYQLALQSYSEALKPGITRKDVEDYLRGKNKAFSQSCCMEQARSNAWDDLTKIGEERSPWYCSKHNVYIGFAFVGTKPHFVPEAHDSDTLTAVRIFHAMEGCL